MHFHLGPKLLADEVRGDGLFLDEWDIQLFILVRLTSESQMDTMNRCTEFFSRFNCDFDET